MTWVSDEPWAYVAYHHGRWHWTLGVGWFWIPGVYYSPAWVAWNHTPGYYGWAPLGYYNTPCHWGYGSWRGGYAWNVVAVVDINLGHVHRRTHHDVNVLRRFNEGSGGTAWTGGGRDLRAPWQRSPLIVSHAEFRNPGQIQTAFRRDVHRERLGAYERQARETTGRVVYRRDVRPVGPVEARPGVPTPGPARRPIEERPPASAPWNRAPRAKGLGNARWSPSRAWTSAAPTRRQGSGLSRRGPAPRNVALSPGPSPRGRWNPRRASAPRNSGPASIARTDGRTRPPGSAAPSPVPARSAARIPPRPSSVKADPPPSRKGPGRSGRARDRASSGAE